MCGGFYAALRYDEMLGPCCIRTEIQAIEPALGAVIKVATTAVPKAHGCEPPECTWEYRKCASYCPHAGKYFAGSAAALTAGPCHYAETCCTRRRLSACS
jgi:hypothetical protein